jgi:carbon-monoxide dehydrogenase large subunit
MAGSILGNVVKRVEDPRFIKGEGRYLDDITMEGMVHVVLVRSSVPYGRIESVDTDDALAMPGVVGVYTAADLDLAPLRGTGGAPRETARPPLADGIVRFVGDVVAAVVAETADQARDAADLIWVDIDPLPAMATPAAAMAEGAPVIHEAFGSNIARTFEAHEGAEDPMEGADVVIAIEILNQRLSAIPLEGSGALASPDDSGEGVSIWLGSQSIYGHVNGIASSLQIDRGLVHARTPDMGGGFGPKFAVYIGHIVAAKLAMKLQRPVKWVESRSENLLDMCHGRDQHQRIRLGAKSDGTLVGIEADIDANCGAYPVFGFYLPYFTMMMATGPYIIPNVKFVARSVITNTNSSHAYRGAGRPEATSMLERALDVLAAELDMDPLALRRRNFIPPEDFPLVSPTGAKYDVGEHAKALDRAAELAGYDALRRDQAERRARGDRLQLGIGIGSYVEVTALAESEWSSVSIEPDGSFTVRVGTSGTGQGHETVFAQIVAAHFQVPLDRVRLVQSDSHEIPKASGTGGSRSLQIGGSVVLGASEGLLDKVKRIVAQLKEASVEDVIVFEGGTIGIAGVPDSAISWAELAAAVANPAVDLPDELIELSFEDEFDQGNPTFPFGTHISVVEVDTESGEVIVLRHIAVDDCGRIFNRLLVDGQVHGGVAQGLGQGLIEHFQYDADGNPLTGNLLSYLIPTAPMLPMIEVDHTETPTPRNPLGAKGIGESGTIGSGAAIHNAVIDAVAHLGVTHIDMPTTPARVWEAMQSAAR